MLNLAGSRMLLESIGNFRVRFQEILIEHHKLENAGGIRRQQINLQVDFRHHHLHNGESGQFAQDLPGLFDRHLGFARNDRHEAGLHVGHAHHDRNLVIVEPVQGFILRAVRRNGIVPSVDLLA